MLPEQFTIRWSDCVFKFTLQNDRYLVTRLQGSQTTMLHVSIKTARNLRIMPKGFCALFLNIQMSGQPAIVLN